MGSQQAEKVMASIHQGHKRLVTLLLKAGAEPDAQVEDCVNGERFGPAAVEI